jgi:hypothetical protein
MCAQGIGSEARGTCTCTSTNKYTCAQKRTSPDVRQHHMYCTHTSNSNIKHHKRAKNKFDLVFHPRSLIGALNFPKYLNFVRIDSVSTVCQCGQVHMFSSRYCTLKKLNVTKKQNSGSGRSGRNSVLPRQNVDVQKTSCTLKKETEQKE